MRRNERWAKIIALRRLRARAERAAVIYSLIQTAKLNEVDPQAWLADVLSRIADAAPANFLP
jgi:hypothetical protein